MTSPSSTDHPLSIALRDLAYGLAKSERWGAFVFPQREQLFLYARCSETDPWQVLEVGVRYKRGQANPEDAERITLIVETALENLGFTIERQKLSEDDTTIISPPIAEMSAHARMEILGRIAPLLCECEETVREMP